MFRWDNFSKTLLRDLARERGLRVTFAVEDLAEAYGLTPDQRLVDDLWPVLRDRWLAGTPASRAAVAVSLREKGVGSKSPRLGSKSGQMEYLKSCRLSDSLRSIVIDEFVRAGSIDAADTNPPAIPTATRAASVPWPAPVGQPRREGDAAAKAPEDRQNDAGLKAVDLLFQQMMIDDEWSIRRPRGFTWWGYRLAQHVEAGEPRPAADGAMGSVIRVWTEVARDVPRDADAATLLAPANMQQSMSALVWDRDAATINECATSPMYDDTVDAWVPLLAAAAVLQNTAAHSRAHAVAELVGGVPASTDHPISGERPAMDDLLNGPAAWVAMADGAPSRFAGHQMLALAAFAEKHEVVGSGDESGFTCEVAYSVDVPAIARVASNAGGGLGTALVQAFTDQPHPELGNGVLWLVRLPKTVDPTTARMTANELNLLEASGESPSKLCGAWCATGSTLNHVSFLPSFVAQDGILENLLVDTMARAAWAHGVLS